MYCGLLVKIWSEITDFFSYVINRNLLYREHLFNCCYFIVNNNYVGLLLFIAVVEWETDCWKISWLFDFVRNGRGMNRLFFSDLLHMLYIQSHGLTILYHNLGLVKFNTWFPGPSSLHNQLLLLINIVNKIVLSLLFFFY